MGHYEERLQNDLDRIKGRVEHLGSLVKKALNDAVRALLTGNEPLAHLTVLRDGPINRKSRAIDSHCHEFIAVHLPSAGLLRLISTIIRANVALERIGDYAVTICRESMQLQGMSHRATARELELLADDTQSMLADAIDALNNGNADIARTTVQRTGKLQLRLAGVYSDLLENEEIGDSTTLIAVFVVFNMLKRVADQAQNLCEETIFAVTGESKPEKLQKILFVGPENSLCNHMAEAIGNKHYGDSCQFTSAGGADVHPALVEFLSEHGIDTGSKRPPPFSADSLEFAEQDVIVSLAGPVRLHVPAVPFHTSALEWDIGPAPDNTADDAAMRRRMEEIYRELAVQIRDLVELLSGPDVD